MDELLGSTSKKYASRYFQLKTGHGAIGTFLARIGVIESPECWWCGEAEQSVEHLYTKCRKWRRQRRKLTRSLSAKKISWQGWTEKKVLAKLVADENPCDYAMLHGLFLTGNLCITLSSTSWISYCSRGVEPRL